MNTSNGINRPEQRSGTQEACSSYVLLTAVHNEEKYIHYPVESVLSQTVPPSVWVIVSDGSTDGTEDLLRKYGETIPFLRWYRLEKDSNNKGFSSKVHALKYAFGKVRRGKYDCIGILDGDVSFGDSYYRNILEEFRKNRKLGIAGGSVHEPDRNGTFRPRSHNRERSVPGAVQMFRRECYEAVGGLKPIAYGGEDAYAEMVARATGWEVRSFPEYPVFHHTPGRLKRGIWKDRYREGKMDYSIGYRPLFELMKFFRRIPEPPVLAGAAVRLIGYMDALAMREERIPPKEMLKRIKEEQWNTMRNALKNPSD